MVISLGKNFRLQNLDNIRCVVRRLSHPLLYLEK